jgi:hypothetical protein
MIPERHLPHVVMNLPLKDSDNEPSAPLWRHLSAMVYDSLLILPLFMAATGLWVAI